MTRVLVVGAGIMGAGIAQVMAEAGCGVVLKEVTDDLLQRGMRTIEKNLERAVAKATMSSERKAEVLRSIKGVVAVEDLRSEASDVDLVIEAIVEDVETKHSLYRELDSICPETAIFGTNTSALSITELAVATQRMDRFIGIHFFNPPTVMELVEVIAGQTTSGETLSWTLEFVRSVGKVPVRVEEAPAFVVARLLVPMVNEAAFMVQEQVASAEDIDTAMRLGANHPIGPLALGDMIGLDVCLSVMETLQRETGDPKYRPCPELRKLVRAGALGRKSGRGFFGYSG
jgi:3-hydroxybutyryl-CoA dehydrogenase